MADEEGGGAKESVDEVTGCPAGDKREGEDLPGVFEFAGRPGGADDECDLDAGKDPGVAGAEGEGGAWVEEEFEAEPITDDGEDLPFAEGMKDQGFAELIDGCDPEGEQCEGA